MKQLLSRLLLVCCLAGLLPVRAGAAAGGQLYTTAELKGHPSENISWNQYDECGSSPYSHLLAGADGTLYRVEYSGEDGLLVETYSSALKLLNKRFIKTALPIYGGFFCGQDYNFLVLGRTNYGCSDEEEVIRVVKYSKAWKRLSSESLLGANTVFPFDLGALRMAEADGKLYIHTCHSTYTSDQQESMTFVLDEGNLDVLQVEFSGGSGLIGDSLNQYVQTDGTYLFRADHSAGGYVLLTRCSVDGSITDVDQTNLLQGRDLACLSLGALELSSGHCLAAGVCESNGQQGIFLSVTDKDLKNTKLVRLSGSDTAELRPPHLVKLSSDRFLVLWEEQNRKTAQVVTKLVTVDGSGTQTSQIVTAPLRLSDCNPLLTSDGLVQWYVTDSSVPTLYTVDPGFLPSYDYSLSLSTAEPGRVCVSVSTEGLSSGSTVAIAAYTRDHQMLGLFTAPIADRSTVDAVFSGEGVSYVTSFVLDGLTDLAPLRYSKTLSVN